MKSRKVIKARWCHDCCNPFMKLSSGISTLEEVSTIAVCPPHDTVRKSCYTTQCTICKATFSDVEHKMGSYVYQGNCQERSTCSACGAYSTRTSHQGFDGANCYSPATCDCGQQTSGSALGHSWVYGHHADSTHPHPMIDQCSRCGATQTGTGYASWSWSYGSWYSISSSEHKRVLTCSRCNYQSSETASHGSWSYGSWYSISDSEHKRTKTCGTCSYLSSETASHSIDWGNWYEDSSSGQCKSQGKCSCGYTGAKWKSHSYSSWSFSVSSATNCKKYADCSSCGGGRTYEYPSHSFGGEYSENGYRKIKCGNCGYVKVLGEDVGACTHPNATWGAWFEGYVTNMVSYCIREKKCPNCKQVLETESIDHSPSDSGIYEPYNETYHYQIGTCRCGKSMKKAVAHTFVNNVCVCGAIYSPGGGGGGTTVTINSFTVTASSSGDAIHCTVNATGAVRYVFNLGVPGGADEDIIASSGLTQSTYYQFQTIPGTYYIVSVTASDAYGRTDTAGETLQTPWAMPKVFSWTNPPAKGKEFKACVTASDWSNLQNIVNAWRARDMLYVYGYTTEYANENSFIMAKTDKAFTYQYFNQIINALSEISHLSYSLPKRKTANPQTWVAQDFLELEKAVNSLRN